MNWRIPALAVGLALAPMPYARGQQAQPDFTQGTNDSWNLDWDGVSDRTYFLQWSENLIDWYYFPLIESGQGLLIAYGFTSTGERLFLRLRYSDEPVSDPYTADFDGDGLTNWEEVNTYMTDPLDGDSDNDGASDGWEIANGFDPNNASDATIDSDGDGLGNAAEYAQNTDPNAKDNPLLQLLVTVD